jgi:heat-inducible transcriptional repressor
VPDSLLNQILYEAYTAIKQADNLEVYMDGTNRMLSLPEFSNISRARSLFDTLAMDGIVSGYINEMSMDDDKATYMIRIGQEISIEGMTDCSFVTTTYNVGDKIAGNIGVIGPKRMEYSKVVSQIGFIRQVINHQLEKIKALNGG